MRSLYVVQDNEDPNLPWSVYDRTSGDLVGRALDEHAAARIAFDNAEMAAAEGERFMAVLCVEGVATADGRYLEPGGGTWRELPQPLMAQTTIPEMGGHAGAVLAGRIDTIRMDGRRMVAEGVFDTNAEGREAARLVDEQMLRFVSIDVADAEVIVDVLATDEDGYPSDVLARFMAYQIMGATATPHPALEQAVIWLSRNSVPSEAMAALPDPLGPPSPVEEVMLASAEPITLAMLASGATRPPGAWFQDPRLEELTPATITDEGRMFGHFAGWGCCHIGYLDRCVEPPHDGDYSYFRTGEVVTAEGTHIPTGTLTVFGGHPDDRLGVHAARAHHDDVSLAAADVVVGEDRFGLWFAGAVRPGVTEEQLRIMRASAPSGDWRPIGGKLRLVNVHYVNTPGFRVPRVRAVVAAGELVGLVASIGGDVTPEPEEELQGETGVLEVADDPTLLARIEALEAHKTAVESAIEPLLTDMLDGIVAAHPAPPEPSALERYLIARGG